MPVTRSLHVRLQDTQPVDYEIGSSPAQHEAQESSKSAASSSAAVHAKMAVKRRVTFSPQSQPALKRYRTASARSASGTVTITKHHETMTPSRAALQVGIEMLEVSTPSNSKVDTRSVHTLLPDEVEPDSAIADMYSQSSLTTPETPSRQLRANRVRASSSGSSRKHLPRPASVAREARDNTTDRQTAQLELQSLLGDADSQCLLRLRHAFHKLREVLVDPPNDPAVDPTNLELLDICVTTIEDLNTRHEVSTIRGDEQATLIRDLYHQTESLLLRLAQADKQRLEMAALKDKKGEEAAALNMKLQKARELIQHFEEQLEQLTVENDELKRTSDKLRRSLQHYRAEEDRLHALIIRMEADHAAMVAKIQRESPRLLQNAGSELCAKKSTAERETLLQTVHDLQHRVQKETARRRRAEHAFSASQADVASLRAEVDNAREQLRRRNAHLGTPPLEDAPPMDIENVQDDVELEGRDASQPSRAEYPTTPTTTERDVEWFSLLCRQTHSLKRIKQRAEEQDETIASLRECSRSLQRSLKRLFAEVDDDVKDLGGGAGNARSIAEQRSRVSIELGRMVTVLGDDEL